MKRFDTSVLWLAVFVVGCSFLLVYSTNRWTQLYAEGVPEKFEIKRTKKDLLSKADLMTTHNRVYENVGEGQWEEVTKPAFLQAITVETIKETGNLFPSSQEIVDWVETHPEEAQNILDPLTEK